MWDVMDESRYQLASSNESMMAKNKTGIESSRTKEEFFPDCVMYLISLYTSLQAAAMMA